MANPKVFLIYFLDRFRIDIFGPLPKKRAVFESLTRGLGVKVNESKKYLIILNEFKPLIELFPSDSFKFVLKF